MNNLSIVTTQPAAIPLWLGLLFIMIVLLCCIAIYFRNLYDEDSDHS